MGDVEVGLEGEHSEDGRGRERRSKHAHHSGAKITLFQVARIFLSCFPEGYSPEEAIRVHYFVNFKNKSSGSNMIHVFHCQDAQKSKPQNLRFLINAGRENETVFYFPLLRVYHWMDIQSK